MLSITFGIVFSFLCNNLALHFTTILWFVLHFCVSVNDPFLCISNQIKEHNIIIFLANSSFSLFLPHYSTPVFVWVQTTMKKTLWFFSSWFHLYSQIWKCYTEEQFPKSLTKQLFTELKGKLNHACFSSLNAYALRCKKQANKQTSKLWFPEPIKFLLFFFSSYQSKSKL